MKKLFLALALAGFVGAGMATPALACEGGKCKMEHAGKDGKTKKGEKAGSCHMMEASATAKEDGKSTASCCAKKDAPKAEDAKEIKNQR
ncbi:hypothetical protein [Pontibacter sp. HSC-36F09]|uniref:hypothetical protein n=1 Tax=Pontibacter sp. HSC-36F09 TaxID=2910966 RepID=UPI0020A0F36E|nr:hypothetical protein [Pontibacter sp. HSC-36F09]MCP2044570.1 hypothetical protein [Pontibacter sp. HSC-36F09]